MTFPLNEKGKYMEYRIFNGTRTVSIKDELISLYEAKVATMNEHRVEYFVASSGQNENSENLDHIVEQAIIEEISAYEMLPTIIKEMRDEYKNHTNLS